MPCDVTGEVTRDHREDDEVKVSGEEVPREPGLLRRLLRWLLNLLPPSTADMIQRRNSKRFILGELSTSIEVTEPEPREVEFDIPSYNSPAQFSAYHLEPPLTSAEIQAWQSPRSLRGRIT